MKFSIFTAEKNLCILLHGKFNRSGKFATQSNMYVSLASRPDDLKFNSTLFSKKYVGEK